MDLFVSNQLKLAGKFLDDVLKLCGSKVNERGVEVMGSLDAGGQTMLRAIKDYMGKDTQTIMARISDLDEKINGDNQIAAMNATAEKIGLELALRY